MKQEFLIETPCCACYIMNMKLIT